MEIIKTYWENDKLINLDSTPPKFWEELQEFT